MLYIRMTLFLFSLFCVPTLWAQKEDQSKIDVKFHESTFPTYVLMGTKGAQNLIESPINIADSFYRTVAGKNYLKLVKNSRKKKEKLKATQEDIDLSNSCQEKTSESPLDSLSKTLGKVDNCECSAWHNCPNRECKLEDLCPFDLSIFKITAHQRIPTQSNSLSFRNHSNDIPYKEITGFCWGHATTTQRLSNLSIFQPTAKVPHKEGSKEWLKFYKKIIDNIVLHNEAQIIPGFSNLYEFSSHPSFKDYFGKTVAKIWAKQAMNIRSIPDSAYFTSSSKKQEKFEESVEELLEFDVTPTIVIAGGITEMGYSHVVVPWKVTKIDGKKVICYRDNSTKVPSNLLCRTTHDHRVDNFSYHAKKDLAVQAQSLRKICKNHYRNKMENLQPIDNTSKDMEKVIDRLIQSNEDEKYKVLIEALHNEYGEIDSPSFAQAAWNSLKEIDYSDFEQKTGIDPFDFFKSQFDLDPRHHLIDNLKVSGNSIQKFLTDSEQFRKLENNTNYYFSDDQVSLFLERLERNQVHISDQVRNNYHFSTQGQLAIMQKYNEDKEDHLNLGRLHSQMIREIYRSKIPQELDPLKSKTAKEFFLGYRDIPRASLMASLLLDQSKKEDQPQKYYDLMREKLKSFKTKQEKTYFYNIISSQDKDLANLLQADMIGSDL